MFVTEEKSAKTENVLMKTIIIRVPAATITVSMLTKRRLVAIIQRTARKPMLIAEERSVRLVPTARTAARAQIVRAAFAIMVSARHHSDNQ